MPHPSNLLSIWTTPPGPGAALAIPAKRAALAQRRLESLEDLV